MANIDDYLNGKILNDVKTALFLLKFIKAPIIGRKIKRKLLEEIKAFEPQIIDLKKALHLIEESKTCAIGERVCRIIHKNSEFTESIFLDELAIGMEKIGKAHFIPKHEAISSLEKYPKNPLILSKVSGKYMEICRSSPCGCVYWNMERRKLKCLN